MRPKKHSLFEFCYLAVTISSIPRNIFFQTVTSTTLYTLGANRLTRHWNITFFSRFIPISTLLSIAVISTVFNLIDPASYPNAMVHLFTGSAMLGAFYIATDPVTSPTSPKGQLFFGVVLGILIYVIRTWAQYPEGMSFAILLMNAVTPLINRYMRPRIFGRTVHGDPLK